MQAFWGGLPGSMKSSRTPRRWDESDAFIAFIEAGESVAVVSQRRNRTEPREYDKALYKERHPVECCSNRLKHYRRVFSRFEKLASRYLAFLHFAATLLWLR